MFDKSYFDKYYSRKSWFGFESGEKPFLYRFWMRKLKNLLPRSAKVLEVGCGAGYFLKRVKNEFYVVGVDISKEALVLAKSKIKTPLPLSSAENLPFKERNFSALIAFDLIEHLSAPEDFIKEASQVLISGGYFIFSTPNPSSFGARIKKQKYELNELSYEKRMMEWYGWRDESHINIKSVEKWQELLRKSGFKIIQDGTDTLWDVPYFKEVPYILQKLIFISIHWILTFTFEFFPWKLGENYVCIAQK